MLMPTRPCSFGYNYMIQRGVQSPMGQMEIQRRYNVITREKPSTHSSEVGKCKELILKKIYRNNKYVHPQHSSSRCGLNTFRMPKPHLFCDLQLNQKVWLCAARGRGLWEEKNQGDDVLLSHQLFVMLGLLITAITGASDLFYRL